MWSRVYELAEAEAEDEMNKAVVVYPDKAYHILLMDTN
jgi:hypothetical protein